MATAGLEPLGLGIVLHADDDYLDLIGTLLDEVDFLEFAPELTWGVRPDGEWVFTRAADRFEQVRGTRGLPVVAHGLGLSPGTASSDPQDAATLERWLDMARRTHERFGFRWYLEHLGYARHSGEYAVLPLPLAHCDSTIHTVAESVRRMRDLHPFVGFENSVWYCSWDLPAQEAAFLRRLYRESQAWLLLDLHNVYTHCLNFGLQWRDYLDDLPAERVLCFHVSGGSSSDGSWVPSGKSYRLDSHDAEVPPTVWDMLAYMLERCPNARGVVVEYMDGTLETRGVDGFVAELRRVRTMWNETVAARVPAVFPLEVPPHDPSLASPEGPRQQALLRAMYAVDAWAELQRQGLIEGTHLDADGVQLSSLLIQKLRFERLVRGSDELAERFDQDPAAFIPLFEAYNQAVAPRWYFPAEEARGFHEFMNQTSSRRKT